MMVAIRTWGVVVLLSLAGVQAADEPPKASPAKSEREVFKKDLAGNAEVEKIIQTFGGRGEVGDNTPPTPATEAAKLFQTTEGLQVELVMAEPQVRQPLFMSFDDRGRMWVVQYLQYPFPEGLKVVKYDQYLRAVFDKVPAAPPNHVQGADRITVYEDTDADGKYDTSKDVITGLNIATAVVQGQGGIWVLNPPYLLFYPDANRDDIPDGDPVVQLSGFGLEDTHSVANSLCWGPDGWLYGANGSTTTANVSSEVTKNVKFLGQCIWRYHPVSKVFEIYAEGGGNTFSLDIDGAGRVFSGTNGGGTRGMYYPQGSYGIKGWAKHGPLTNPYAFGWFEHMRHEGDGDRFPQTFAIYEGGLLPEKFHGMVLSANALHNRVWASELMPDSSTYRTKDLPPIVTTPDRWFRPVDLKVGPDGAVYIADWYDTRLSHVDPRDNWDKESGRIYRISGKDSVPDLSPTGKPWTATDFTKLESDQLRRLLSHENKWVRFTAIRTLSDRMAHDEKPTMRNGLANRVMTNSPEALEALWIVYRTGGFTPQLALELLGSRNEDIRRWTVRLIGDDRRIDEALAARMAKLASEESYVQVRSQLASTAKRLPAKFALPIVQALLQRDEDATDLHMPLLLWWAIEAQCGNEREEVVKLFGDKSLWDHPITAKTIVPRLMQRYALAGSPEDLETCATLLAIAPSDAHRQTLISGFLEAFQGREIKQLPESLTQAITSYQKSIGQDDLVLNIRLGQTDAIDSALQFIANEGADRPKRLTYIAVLGEVKPAKAVPVLINLMASPSIAIKRATLQALINFEDPSIGEAICTRYHSQLPDEQDLRSIAHRVLASRAPWAKRLLMEVDAFRIKAAVIPLDVVQQMRLHNDPEVQALLNKLWGKTRASSEEKKTQVARLRTALVAQRGKAADAEQLTRGHALFTKHCATCHTLFQEGGKTGPDLTGYERDNLDFMLLSVVDPSAAIREEFTQFQIVTTSGLTLTGLIDKQDDRTVSIRGANNQTTLLNRDEVEVLKAMDTSIMPDGLVEKINDAELADLFAYVMTRTPPVKTADSMTGTKPGEVREFTLPGGVKLKQVWCPPGTFTMGTPGATDNEAPVQVTLKGYWLAATETTQGQYTAVMGSSPWVEHGEADYYKAGPNFPASYITHTEAEAYCAKLTEIERKAGRLPTGWKYALPTESQWEYACRAGTKTVYSFGNDESQLGEYAWFAQNAYDIGEKYGHAVGTKMPNPWGLSDMYGNVWEWCRDTYDPQLPGGADPLAVSSDRAAFWVNRGGSWLDASVFCRSAYRGGLLPSNRLNYLGFRPAAVPVESD